MNITSNHNERIKFVKRLERRRFREQQGLFVAEGVRLVESILDRGQLCEVYYSQKILESSRGHRLIQQIKTEKVASYYCTDQVLATISQTDTSQGILATVRQPRPIVDWSSPAKKDLILIIDRIQDPGNLGTILRTALGVGVDGIWLIEGTVDLFNPKVVRASAGAVLGLPFSYMSSATCVAHARDLGLELIASEIEDGVSYFKCNFLQPVALIIGNEANGVSDFLKFQASRKVFIPQTESVQSLNAAIATAVLLYEIKRQRD